MTRETLWRRLWTAFLALVWAAVNVHTLEESDAFWHAAFGREIARHHARVFPEPFSFAATTARSQEWLWDLTTYFLTSRFGWSALSALVIALAALAAIAVTSAAWEHRDADDARPLGALIATTALVAPPMLSRIRERPETAAMVLLPLLLLLGHRLAAAPTPSARARVAVAVFVTELVFVQLHPSFVLGAVVIAVLAGPELALGGAHARRTGIALAVGFALAFATNIPALTSLGAHMSGFAVAHVTDMEPPFWELVNPAKSPLFASYALIWLAAIVAMAKARRVFLRPLLLALVGALIAARASRGIGPGAVLAIPLAMSSFGELLAGARDKTLAPLVGGVFLLVRMAQWVDASTDGLGVIGLDPGAYPFAGARVLEAATPGTRVLTTYDTGAPLAYWLDGRVRTFVDSRTPLVFGDAAYGEAHAIWYREASLARATERFTVEAAVVERELPICEQLEASPEWAVATIEPRFATFIRRAGPLRDTHALTSFRACASPSHLRPEACRNAETLAADLTAIATTTSAGFARFLRAVSTTQCTDQSFDADAVVALLEPRDAARGFLPERDGLLAWVYAKADREDSVRSLVMPYLDRPWGLSQAAPMLPALRALRPTASARDIFARAYAILNDTAPGWLDAKLALACVADNDASCVELYAIRAAGAGETQVTPALCWLTRRGHEGATRWVEVLHQQCP